MKSYHRNALITARYASRRVGGRMELDTQMYDGHGDALPPSFMLRAIENMPLISIFV